MTFNKLNNLIEKYKLTNIIKIFIIIIVLYLITRVFIPNYTINSLIPVIVENFDNLNNGTIYGNELSLNEPKNTPKYNRNTCVLELSGIYRIDSMKLIFNNNPNANTVNSNIVKYDKSKNIIIQFQDGNGNLINLKTSSHNDSPANFSTDVQSDMSLSLNSITDENGASIYTSKIILTIGDNSNIIDSFYDASGNGYISKFGIYGGDRNLLSPTDYNTLTTTLSKMLLSSTSSPNPTQPQSHNTINTYIFNTINNNGNNTLIYAIQLNILIVNNQLSITTNSSLTTPQIIYPSTFQTTESPFNITISYSNNIYPKNSFPITQTYFVRSDANRLNSTSSFIFLVDPIIANSITFSVQNVNNVNDNNNPSGTKTLKITSISILGKTPNATDILNYKTNVNNAINSIESEDQNGTICPNINDLVDKQNKTQQICDNLEYQDKTKSEKLRLERNKQYLLKLKNQQEKIDQLNNVIQSLETQRDNRATISDKVRVLQYQKQAEDASKIRDLANQRLESQANNQLYLDVNIK